MVGETLSAVIKSYEGEIDYNDILTYQWMSSSDGVNWENIKGANSRSYVVTENDFLKYIRVSVSSENSVYLANVGEKVSLGTAVKTVISGDVNLNFYVNIDDATEAQKIIAKIMPQTEGAVLAGDVNLDGALDIDDVTLIQKYLAGYFDKLPVK